MLIVGDLLLVKGASLAGGMPQVYVELLIKGVMFRTSSRVYAQRVGSTINIVLGRTILVQMTKGWNR